MQSLCSAIAQVLELSDSQPEDETLDGSSQQQQQTCASWLLQLPGPALQQVLQQLDQRILACLAATCSSLQHATPAACSKVALRCCSPETLGSFNSWLNGHSSSLTYLTQCSIIGSITGDEAVPTQLYTLRCPHLRQLHLAELEVQLSPSGAHPGVLHDCTGLQELELWRVDVLHGPTKAAAAIAALPELQHLHLAEVDSAQQLLAKLQLPVTVTYISVDLDPLATTAEEIEQLSQLSGLVNLQHLSLVDLPPFGLSGGLPSQLVKLTHLDLSYRSGCNTAEQFQHLSSLTALQQLSIECDNLEAGGLQGFECLLQLTRLELDSRALHFTTASSSSSCSSSGGSSSGSILACLTALQSLALASCQVQPEALERLTNLRSLSLDGAVLPEDDESSVRDLMGAASQLKLLTELCFVSDIYQSWLLRPHFTGPFTALTASSNLCSLQLGLLHSELPTGWELCTPGVVYPHLRTVDLAYQCSSAAAPLNERHLQQLSSCCPAVDTLRCSLCAGTSPSALRPLLQLSALTRLELCRVEAAMAAVLEVVAQLTGLKHLELLGVPELADPVLLQLTALTAVEQLTVETLDEDDDFVHYVLLNKARWARPSDVWQQLQDHLAASV